MKKANFKTIIENKKTYYDYEILSKFEVGIELKGSEVKSLRAKKVNVRESYIKIINNELYIINLNILKIKHDTQNNLAQDRMRRLLAHKKQIIKLRDEVKNKGLTLVPVKIYFKNQYVKILLGVAKGKKNYDKRRVIKEKDIQREIAKQLKKY